MSLHFPLIADAKLDTAQPSPRFKSVAGEGDAPLKVGTAVLSSEDVFSPVMVMKQSALENNLRQLARFARRKASCWRHMAKPQWHRQSYAGP